MALSISHLRGDDLEIACKCFGPPPTTITTKFTGGEPQHYQKVRRDLQMLANGKNIWDMIDYQVWVLSLGAGAVPNFGAQGSNIVEAIVLVQVPNRGISVTMPLNFASANEVANHTQRILDIGQAFPGNTARDTQKRREEQYRADCDHRAEMSRITTTYQNSLESRFEAEQERYRKATLDFEDDQAKCTELFLRLFNGPALMSIQAYLQTNSYRRALYMLDQQFGLAPANQEAIDVLQDKLRNWKFRDAENFRTQLDDFVMSLNELLRLGVVLSDPDKIGMLFKCLRNGGVIGRLFIHDIALLRSRVLATVTNAAPLTYAVALEAVNHRYNDLTAEVSSLEVAAKRTSEMPGGDKPYKKKRMSAYFTESRSSNDVDVDDDDDDPPEVALAAVMKPHQGSSPNSMTSKPRCGKCGRIGHTGKDCLRDYTCKKCGKNGHKEEECWKDQTCSKCGKKGHTARFCRAKLWKKNLGKKTGSSGSSSNGGTLTERVMKHVRGRGSA